MFWSTLSVVASETWNDITCIWRFRDEPDLNLHILWQYSKAKHFTLVCKIFHSLHVHCMHRVCTHLENPWNLRISGVLFQGLEITWNWFFVLESPWFFIEQDWKILMFISFKWNESQWKQLFMTGNQSIKFLKCFETCTQGPLVTFVHVHWATSA